MPTPPALAADYPTARARFVEAAAGAGATVSSEPLVEVGPAGEELAVDLAWIGDDDADDVVLIVSGTHGVEGYAGSMCQSRWLAADGAKARPENVAVAVLHAFNPYGFAWVRRVNEDNVDVNRNFIDFGDPTGLPANGGYDQLADLLAPAEITPEALATADEKLLAFASEHGFAALQEAASGGQYHHPDGLFYGGAGPVRSRQVLEKLAADRLSSHRRVVALDLHTGLGERGDVELICPHPPGSPALAQAEAWWGERVASNAGGESVSAELHGEWLTALPRLAAPAEVSGIAVEWGTVDGTRVLRALRADNWLHQNGDPTGPDAPAIKAELRQAFAPDAPDWAATVYDCFTGVVADTFAALR